MANVHAGSARADITPKKPVFMGGFGQRTKRCEGVHDRLYAKALYLSSGESPLLIITTDLIHVPLGLVGAVMERVGRREGIPGQALCITASHTHSGPLLAQSDGEPEREYLEFLVDALGGLASDAVRDAAPAELRMGSGSVNFLFNRRTRGKPNLADNRIFALAVSDLETNEMKAVLFGCGCHPVALGWENHLLSADFPGYAQRVVEEKLAARNGLFFNMAAGNILPDVRPNTDALDPRGYREGSFSDAAHIGKLLGAEVVRVVKGASPVTEVEITCAREECRIGATRAGLDLCTVREELLLHQKTIEGYLGHVDWTRANGTPGQVPTLWADASHEVIEAEMPEEEMRLLMAATALYRVMYTRLQNPDRLHYDVPVQVVAINQYRFIALPGEVMTETAFEWQERNGPSPAFVISLANGHFRYIPHASNTREPGWEMKYETMANSLEPQAGTILLDTGERLLKARARRKE